MIDSSKSIVERYISEDKLQKNIHELESVVKKVNRLYFIRLLYKDYSVKEVCDILGIPSRKDYNWLEKFIAKN
ncbi:MAG: helix-turn-helix domain-containing protein [Methanobacteriaceae archaeon]|jgi:DNA-directed RNA polymerase specialized sigma subunit|nr:helix-turn-helix domain-containing protein [Methanobacteriaceae archaeon]